MKKLIVLIAVCFAGTAFAGDKAAMPADPAKPMMKKAKGEGDYAFAADHKWEMPMGDKGPAFAVVTGDMSPKGKGKPISFFLKIGPGFDSSWHTHDSDYTAVVLSGVVTHQVQGGEVHKLAAGSYWTNAAKVNHTNGCMADGGECLIFVTEPKGFSFTPKTADGKDVPAPAKDPKASGGSH